MGRLRAPNQASARRAAGLTLIELMVVVAIAVIILGLAAPSFSEYIVTQRLRSIHAQLATDLQLARSEAVARSSFVGVRFQEVTGAGGLTCYVIFTRPEPTVTSTDTCSCTEAPGARCDSHPTTTSELRTVTIPADLKVRVQKTQGPTDTLVFDPRTGMFVFAGQDSRVADSVQYEVETSADASRVLRAVINPTGRAMTCTPAGSRLGGTSC
jgi:prepilin-type N-terminal cleavage/methylation domain-containing protein